MTFVAFLGALSRRVVKVTPVYRGDVVVLNVVSVGFPSSYIVCAIDNV